MSRTDSDYVDFAGWLVECHETAPEDAYELARGWLDEDPKRGLEDAMIEFAESIID